MPTSLWEILVCETHWRMCAHKFWRPSGLCPSFPNGGRVPLNSWGFVSLDSGSSVPSSPLEDSVEDMWPYIWEALCPLFSQWRVCDPKFYRICVPKFWEDCAPIPSRGCVPLNSGRHCAQPLSGKDMCPITLEWYARVPSDGLIWWLCDPKF